MSSARFASLFGPLGFGMAAVIPLPVIDFFFLPRSPQTPITLDLSADFFLVTGLFLPTSAITLIANRLRAKPTRPGNPACGILACYALLGLALNPIAWVLSLGTLGLYCLLAPFSIFFCTLICTAAAHIRHYLRPA